MGGQIIANPYDPLPANYPSLNQEEQRAARVAACCNQTTSDDLVKAWAFFRKYYLFTTPAKEWYGHGVVPSPQFHYQIVKDIGDYPVNCWAAPRSYAKSTVLAGEIPLLLALTRPNIKITLVFSTGQRCRIRFGTFMRQLSSNKRILEDFGKLEPKKGKGSWNRSVMELTNGSTLVGFPVKGQMLGERPDLMLFDDVEYDDALVHQPEALKELSERFHLMMTEIVLPMMEVGTSLGIIGTMHNRRFYIYMVQTTHDPRYVDGWNRRLHTICGPDDPEKPRRKIGDPVEWPEKFTQEFLDEKLKLMGPAAFYCAYYNRPSSEKDRILVLHPELSQYSTVGAIAEDPLASTATIHTSNKAGSDPATGNPIIQRVEMPFGEAVSRMYRLLLLDPAFKVSPRSDYTCAIVLGFQNDPEVRDMLWVLDVFLGRIPRKTIIDRMWDMGEKWRVQVVGIESVATQEELKDRTEAEFAERISRSGWRPRVVSIRYPSGVSKSDRIAAMQWRFSNCHVKLPVDRKTEFAVKELYYQLENFTLDLNLLPHDDAVDALSMHQYVLRPRRPAKPGDDGKTRDPIELLRQGELFLPDLSVKIPVAGAIPLSRITPEILDLFRAAQEEETDPSTSPGWSIVGGS